MKDVGKRWGFEAGLEVGRHCRVTCPASNTFSCFPRLILNPVPNYPVSDFIFMPAIGGHMTYQCLNESQFCPFSAPGSRSKVEGGGGL